MDGMPQLDDILGVCLKTLSWITGLDDWRTFDPYDLKGRPLVMKLAASSVRLARTAERALYWASLLAPKAVRRLGGVKPTVTASGIAYALSGLSRLYSCGFPAASEDLGLLCKDAFSELTALRNPMKGWGTPFPWYSSQGVTIPANVTLSYTTYTAVEALMDYFDTGLCDEALEVAVTALTAIADELNRSEVRGGTALSYSRFDEYQVINTNALLAGVMARVSRSARINHLSELAEDMIAFVVNSQLGSGKWPYFAEGGETDNYHTAMTIQGLAQYVVEADEESAAVAASIRSGVEFYVRRFITQEGMPVLNEDGKNTVDIAGCAECIELFWRYAPVLRRLELDVSTGTAVLTWSVNNMLLPSGEWIYRSYGRIPVRLGSLRWGQAMMLRSLASVYAALSL